MKKILSIVLGVAVLLPSIAFASVGITLTGGNVVITQGQSYSEPGYSAFSTVDGNITSLVNVSGGGSTVGTYTIGYSVTDSTLASASASRTLTIRGSGSVMPFCSGPMAPGWQVGIDGGGCGGHGHFIPSGTSYSPAGVSGKPVTCPAWFPSGCITQ